MTQTSIQSSMDVEAYPKAGAPNPIAEVFVYDVAARDEGGRRDGKPFTTSGDGSQFTNDNVGHYVYNVRWSPDGTRAADEPHEPPAEHHGARRLRSGVRRMPRHRPRRVADRLGGQLAADDATSRDQQAVHLGVRAQRLHELLPLRPDRQAHQPDHGSHDVRSRARS